MSPDKEGNKHRASDRSRVILEVCCGSAEDGINAAKGGADRIELNSALELGGLTPSAASLRMIKKQTTVPVICMSRPRPGGFCYSDLEKEQMYEDALILLEEGADGIAFGFLNKDGTVDEEATVKMTDLIHSMKKEAVFHRAFDITPDFRKAFLLLKQIGIDRILTSGHHASAADGIEEIRELAKMDGPQILPGSGIRKDNAPEIIQAGRIGQIHSSCRTLKKDEACRNGSVDFGVNEDFGKAQTGFTDPVKTAELAAICHQQGGRE